MTALALSSAACGRSSSPVANHDASTSSSAGSPSASSTSSAGSFGSLKNICGPGNAKGATARGVTDTEINIAVFSDLGNTIVPGLGKEFVQTAESFATWCNAAGGINGRKIVIHSRDGKLFNSAAAVVNACQTDFMDVGGAMALDEATVKPRVACKLGDIPAYHVSVAAVQAPYQVQINGAPSTSAVVAGALAMARLDPAITAHTGLYASNLSSTFALTKRSVLALEKSGFTVKDVQKVPTAVTNWRPYVSSSQQAGTQFINVSGVGGYSSFFAGFQDVGYQPKYLMFSPDTYGPALADGVKQATNPAPSYVYTQFLPFELRSQVPVVQQAYDVLTKNTAPDRLGAWNQLSLSAWLLWAQSATACGSGLTVDCVLQKAGANSAWTSAGLQGAVNLDPGHLAYSNCYLILSITKSGWSYDKAATKPTQDYFNCDPANVVSGLPEN